jgi:hypothetical protein
MGSRMQHNGFSLFLPAKLAVQALRIGIAAGPRRSISTFRGGLTETSAGSWGFEG